MKYETIRNDKRDNRISNKIFEAHWRLSERSNRMRENGTTKRVYKVTVQGKTRRQRPKEESEKSGIRWDVVWYREDYREMDKIKR